MSYILNALRKSEQQRQTDQIPTLEKSVLENKTEEKGWKSSLVLLLIIVNLITFALFIWLYRENSNSMTPAVEKMVTKLPSEPLTKTDKVKAITTSAANTHSGIAQSSAPFTTSGHSKTISGIVQQRKLHRGSTNQTTAEKNKTPGVINQYQSLASINKSPRAHINEPTASISTKQETTNAKSRAKTPDSTHEKSAAITGSHNTSPIANSHRTQVAPSSSAMSKQARESSIPWLKQLPNNFRNRVPSLNINVFAYSENPNERFVLIDMVKYTTGQQITTDMQLKEILTDSMVVKFGGKTFRIQRP